MPSSENIYKPFYTSLGVCAIMVVLTLVVSNLVTYSPSFNDTWEEIRFDQKYERYQHGEAIATAYAITHPDPDTQIRWIESHFSNPELHRIPGANIPDNSPIDRSDADVYTGLEERMNNKDPEISNQGLWGMALAKTLDKEFLEVDDYLNKVTDNRNPYVLYTKAIYNGSQRKTTSFNYIDSAIVLQPKNKYFIQTKIRLLISFGKKKELDTYLGQPNILQEASSHVREDYYFGQQQWGNYWIEILTHQFRYINIISFLGAFLIALFWGYYLYQLDIFNPDPKRYMVICFAMASLLTYTGWFLYKIFHYYLESDLNGNLWNDLFYSVFTIGMIEEVLKVIPLLLMIYLFKKGKEPYDYIKYACVSALGFAFIENIMYIDNYGMNVLDGRFIFAGFGHIFDSCIIGYALAVNKFHWKKPLMVIFPLALILAAIIHGIYDFFLISTSAQSFWILSILVIILSLFIFHGFINNTLNNSTYFDKSVKFPTIRIISYTIGGSFIVLGCGYTMSALYYGTTYSLYNFLSTLFSLNTLFVAVFLVTLNSITLIPNGWLNVIHFFRINNNRASSGLRKGNTIQIHPFTKNEVIQLMFPARGVVVRSYKNEKGKFYLIKLDKSYPINVEVTDHIMITLKEKNTSNDNIIGVFLIKQQQMLSRDFLHMNFIQYAGWAILDFEVKTKKE